jgi:transcriptional regulator with GAF, ATPase, and Fis domain
MENYNEDLSLLIAINDDIATIRDKENLILSILQRLHDFYRIKIVGLALFDKTKEKLGFIIAKIEEDKKIIDSLKWLQIFSVHYTPFKISINNPKITHVEAKHFYSMQPQTEEQPMLKEVLKDMRINTLSLLPMKTGGELNGFLIFSPEGNNLSKKGEDYLLNLANLISSVINNVNTYEELQRKEKEKEMQIRLLADLVTIKEKDAFYRKLAEETNKLIPCEYFGLYAEHPAIKLSRTFSLNKENKGQFKNITLTRNMALSLLAIKSKVDQINGQNYLEITGEPLAILCEQFSHIRQLKEKYAITSLLILHYADKIFGEVNIILGRKYPFLQRIEKVTGLMHSQNKDAFFAQSEIDLGINLLPQLGLILSNLNSIEEIQILTKKLEQEKSYLLDEINLTNSIQEIIGNSPQINNSLNKVKQVAPLDVTVLILGETGTGKELIARAIHNLSNRKDNTFITVNCAALPVQLIESELFGHEKGSFTGALEKRIGKFEIADGGTIFLDEIGELPLEIQAKLLRVLQEKEFERLGGKSVIHSDVRIVAATNRDLEKEIEQGKFRADLFFRLNVFPILVPPLRERKDDIPLLVKYFIDKYSKKIGKELKSIRKNDMDMMMQYSWPGNIRELEHLIERALIISDGSNLNFEKLLGDNLPKNEPDSKPFKTLVEMEKDHIINALKMSDGKVTGENSAAHLLGLNGKSLGSKMKKLGIKREIVITTSH